MRCTAIFIIVIIIIFVVIFGFVQSNKAQESYTASNIMKKLMTTDAQTVQGQSVEELDGTFVLVRVERNTAPTLFPDIVNMTNWNCPNGEGGECTGTLTFEVPPEELRESFDASAIEYMRAKLNPSGIRVNVKVPVKVSVGFRGTYLIALVNPDTEPRLLPNLAEFVSPDPCNPGDLCSGTVTYVGDTPNEFNLIQTLQSNLVSVNQQSVSIDRTAAIFGVVDISNKGEAYIYEKTVAGVWAPNPVLLQENDDSFGWSVSIDGDSTIVGAPSADNNGGKVFIYQKEGGRWNPTPVVSFNNAEFPNGQFGFSVALRDNSAIIGTPGNESPNFTYIQKIEGIWIDRGLFSHPDTPNSSFGHSVALADNGVISGAPKDTSDIGAAFIYQKNEDNTLTPQVKLTGIVEGGNFGWSVAIDGDHVIVGAPNEGRGGVVYIYKKIGPFWGTLNPESVATLQGRPNDDGFGWNVSLSGDIAMVGTRQGNVYFYQNEGMDVWQQVSTLTFPQAVPTGTTLSIKSNSAIIGVISAGNDGNAYIYGQTLPTTQRRTLK